MQAKHSLVHIKVKNTLNLCSVTFHTLVRVYIIPGMVHKELVTRASSQEELIGIKTMVGGDLSLVEIICTHKPPT